MKATLFLALSFCCTKVFTQSKKEDFSFTKYQRKEMVFIKPLAGSRVNIPFSSITVFDERADTSAVFFNKQEYYNIKKLDSSIAAYLNNSVVMNATPGTDIKLIIFIKKLWLTNQFDLTNRDDKDRSEINGDWTDGILFKSECYFKTDSFFVPVFRMDTAFAGERNMVLPEAPLLLDKCLRRLVEKMGQYQIPGTGATFKKISREAIDQFNRSRYDVPVLKDAVYKKGVYETFEDFKLNRPRYTNFQVQKEKLSDELYIKQDDGSELLERNIWGYCDGVNLFIKSADNYFQLFRYGNSFYLKGAKGIRRSINIKAGNAAMNGLFGVVGGQNKKASFDISYRAYQLDMDSGKIF